jgi:hypothetical protein
MISARLRGIGLVLAACGGTPLCAQTAPTLRGTRVEVFARQQSHTGELLAVSSDTLWVWGESGLMASPVSSLTEVRIRQHSFTSGTMLLWGVFGGITSGVILTVACSSYQAEELSCGPVLPVFTLSGLLMGGLAALISGPSAYREFSPTQTQDLRAYARFPQGLPPGVDPSRLAGPRMPPP